MRRGFGIGLTALCLLGTGFVVWWQLWDGARPPPAPPGWALESEGLESRPGGWRATGTATLSRRGWELEIASGSELEARDEGALPLLTKGALRLRGVGAVKLDETLVTASERGTEVHVTPDRLEVVSGQVRVDGQLIIAGERLNRPLLVGRPRLPGSGAAGVVSGGPGPLAQGRAGRVLDARDGSPLGARILVTFSHSPDGAPPVSLAGSQRELQADPDGFFTLPAFAPGDARLRAVLQVEADGYLPGHHVLDRHDVPRGTWPAPRILLRPGRTEILHAIDDVTEELLPGTLVSLTRPRRLPFLARDGFRDDGNLSPEFARRRYTWSDGALLMPAGGGFLGLNSTTRHIWDPVSLRRACGTLSTEDGENWWLRVRDNRVREYLVLDQDRNPLPGMLVEIELSGQLPARVITGERGDVLLGAAPACPGESPISERNPRRGVLRTLSPGLWRHEVAIAIPSVDRDIRIAGRVTRELLLRTMARDEDTAALRAVAPVGIHIDHDLTLVEAHADGRVRFQGALPATGREIELRVDGYLPARVRMPGSAVDAQALDLGEVVFDRGAEITFRVHAPTGGLASGRWELALGPEDEPDQIQRLAVPANGVVTVGGIQVGETYHYTVEDGQHEGVAGELVAAARVIEEGLDVTVDLVEERVLRLSGRVAGVDPEDAHRCQIVERYFLAGQDEPVSFAPYPLAPDLRFGSVRRVDAAAAVEVFVLGGPLRFAQGFRNLRATERSVNLGQLDVVTARRIELAFHVVGDAGPMAVLPPRGLRLFADELDYHEVVHMGVKDDGFTLVLENLMSVRYVLSWGEDGEEPESWSFEVSPKDVHLEGFVERRPDRVETVRLELVDLDGVPVTGAQVLSRRVAPLPDENPVAVEVATGVYAVPLLTGSENRLEIRQEDHLPADLVLPQGRAPEDAVALRRPTAVRVPVRGPDGGRFDGRVRLSWSPQIHDGLDAGRTRLEGRASHIDVVGGLLETDQLPEGPVQLEVRHTTSEAWARISLDLEPHDHVELATWLLEERRTLRGVVRLPGGRKPAAGAAVFVIDADSARRYPEHPLDGDAVLAATRTDGLGGFELDVLPVDLTGDVALVAHLDGYTDALIDPLEPDAVASLAELELLLPTSLTIDAGYRTFAGDPAYEFRLRYDAGPRNPAELDLGAVQITPEGPRVHQGIEPGRYRLSWRRTDAAPGEVLEEVEVEVEPGIARRLRLIITDTLQDGRARFNGAPLASGWVVLATDPAAPHTWRRAPVTAGRFQILVPADVEYLHATLWPGAEDDEFAPPRLAWGEGVFQGRIPADADRRAPLRVHVAAHDLTVHIAPRLLERFPDLQIEFPHYSWEDDEYRLRTVAEPIREVPVRLRLLRPGAFTFSIVAPGNWRSTRTVQLESDSDHHFHR